MMRLLKDFDNPRKQARRLDFLAVVTVYGLLAALFIGLYFLTSFEIAVLAALSMLIMQQVEVKV